MFNVKGGTGRWLPFQYGVGSRWWSPFWVIEIPNSTKDPKMN